MSKSISQGSSAFSELKGIDLNKLSNMKPSKAFEEIAEALSKVQNPFDRVRLSMEIFGRSGANLLPMLSKGAAGIREFQKEADRLHIPVDEAGSQMTGRAIDEFDKLTKAREGFWNQLSTLSSPVQTEIFKDMTKGISQPGEALDGVQSKWQEIGMAIQGSQSKLQTFYKLSQIYFGHVSEAAAKSSNDLGKTQDAAAAAVDVDNAEKYGDFLKRAGDIQKDIAKSAIDSTKELRSQQIQTAQSLLDKRFEGMGIKPIDVQVGFSGMDVFANFASAQGRMNAVVTQTTAMQRDFARQTEQINIAFLAGNIDLKKRNELLREASQFVGAPLPTVENISAVNNQLQVITRINLAYEQQRISIEKRNELLSSVVPTIKIPQIAPVNLQFNVPDLSERFALIRRMIDQDIRLGKITVEVGTEQIEAAGKAFDELREKQNSMVQQALDGQKRIKDAQLQTLQGLLTAQHDAWAKANPALAFQEEFANKVAQINDLFRSQLISLEKRNELLAFAAQIKSPATEDAENKMKEREKEMRERGKHIADSFRNPFEVFQDKVVDLQKLFRAGAIDPATYTQAFKQARAELTGGLKEIGPDKAIAAQEKFLTKVQAIQNQFKSGFIDEKQVKDAMQIAKIELSDALSDPIKEFSIKPAAIEAGTQQAFSAFQMNKEGVAQVNEQKKTNTKLDTLIRKGIVLAAAKL